MNWNPHAIKDLFAAKEQLLDFKQKAYMTYENISYARQTDPRDNTVKEVTVNEESDQEETSIFVFAHMDTFGISLNSAKVRLIRVCLHQ